MIKGATWLAISIYRISPYSLIFSFHFGRLLQKVQNHNHNTGAGVEGREKERKKEQLQ